MHDFTGRIAQAAESTRVRAMGLRGAALCKVRRQSNDSNEAI